MNIRKVHKGLIWAAAMILTVISACSEPFLSPVPEYSGRRDDSTRMPGDIYRNVFLIYSCGFNNISSYLKEDIEDVASSSLMSHFRDVVLVFSHSTRNYGNYSQKTSPILTRFRKDRDGSLIRDTLMVMDYNTVSASANTLNEVLTYIHGNFPARSYGMLFTSHGTGWVPAGYASDPSDFDPSDGSTDNIWSVRKRKADTPTPYFELPLTGSPAVKSFGVQNIDLTSAYEMEIQDIADAIPMKMDYIIFDACFMGGIEVAYEFRDVCDRMIFSQTEILADGMEYETMTSYLFNNGTPDLEGFCRNYFRYYDSKSGEFRSATISLVDCTALEPLADVCREIFSSNRDGIAALEGNRRKVQRYFRNEYEELHKWFYDLESIARNCGADQTQMEQLAEALDRCIIYKAATERFMTIPITEHCGLSMYLPYKKRTYLNTYYKGLDWNIKTGLVQ